MSARNWGQHFSPWEMHKQQGLNWPRISLAGGEKGSGNRVTEEERAGFSGLASTKARRLPEALRTGAAEHVSVVEIQDRG